ncbi:MAG: restriction endonuclease subunit S [Muribaculaceae bacterium]|nr:restriction endonuclease subunit S [Muribaculaceae bacterium]
MKYISTVPFSGLFNWSVQYLNDSKIAFSKAYPMMRIGEFLKRNKTTVVIEDDVIYKRPRIRVRNGGISLRDEILGEKIGTKNQFLISKGQFLLSKIDARNGAFGVVPEKLDGGIITGNFWTFDVNYDIVNPHYLALLTTTKAFVNFCEQASNGTTNRHYLQEPLFLNIKVPIPSLAEQNKLVKEYNKQIFIAIDSERQVAAKYSDINAILLTELGVNISKETAQKGLATVSFSSLDRWDIGYLQNTSKFSTKYKAVKFRDCIEYFMKSSNGKSLRIETYKTPSKDFRYIGMEHIEKGTGQLLETPIIKGAQVKSQTIAVPDGYFIYGKLRPYLNKYWYNDTNWENLVCSSELFVFKVKESINTRFFEIVLGSSIVQVQITDLTSGARMPRITEDVFMNIQIPIPSFDIQNSIVKRIDKIKGEIKKLQQTATIKYSSALTNFETLIFE